ncbi:MAG: tRNA-dihydrouridine synthase family protein [Clostridia bacterium]|nr:tRNA-dihydrouridine synthase family protein [Clostridia bacterium]MBQ8761999.1 tRNA-dihydrouridine synthase family protein [Clostridia bacterium]
MKTKFKFKKFIYALAPMAGVTDFAFREICSDFGADMVVSEMISAKALEYNNARTQKMLKENSTCIKSVQLFGHDPKAVAKVVSSGILDKFDIIDFNCGCPAKKIVGNNDGSAMMRDIEHTRQVLQALRNNTCKPISVKFRLGIDNRINFIEFGKMCEEVGVDFVTLHARTREQGYSGEVDKKAYVELINNVNIPVIWSGDISSSKDVKYAKSIGCAGVMIGREALGNPEIFAKLKHKKVNFTKKEIVLRHLNNMREYFENDDATFSYFKKHLLWYLKNYKNATELKKQVCFMQSLQEMYNFIEKNI